MTLDENILEVCKMTGWLDNAISASEKDSEHEIFEGGLGLFGGQKQFVNLTPAVLLKILF